MTRRPDKPSEDQGSCSSRLSDPQHFRPQNIRDLLVLAIVFVSATAICWQFALPWFFANILLLGIPLTYLLIRSEKARKKIRVKFTLLFVLFATLFFDYLAERYQGWTGPTILPFKFPGGVTLEEIQWIGFYFPLILAINEHFFATPIIRPPKPTAKLILKTSFYSGLIFILLPALHPLLSQHVYLKVGILTMVPYTLLGLWVNPLIQRELLLTGIVSGAFNLLFELLALKNGYWEFHGSYVGMVSILGFVFPVEEFVFLILLSGPSIVGTYAVYKNWKQI